MHKNVIAFIFLPSTAPPPGSTTPAFPFLYRPGSPVPATKPAPRPSFLPNFIFLTPLYFFRPAQGEVKKRPHTYPTFALSNPQS